MSSKRTNALSALKDELMRKKQALTKPPDSSGSSSSSSSCVNPQITDQLDQLRKVNSSKTGLFMDFHTKVSTMQKPTPLELAKKARKDARYEEELALIASRESLERKAKLYEEKLQQMTRALEQGQQCDTPDLTETDDSVIDFQAKAIDMLRNPQDYQDNLDRNSPCVSSDSSDENDDGTEKGWTEYVDSFGRTRKCLKSEIAHLKRLDREITDQPSYDHLITVDKRGTRAEVPPPGYTGSYTGNSSTPTESTGQPNEYRRPGYDKDFVRYRDILGDEVRDHGVGYFALSGDEEKRKRQLDYLASLRSDTTNQKKSKTS